MDVRRLFDDPLAGADAACLAGSDGANHLRMLVGFALADDD